MKHYCLFGLIASALLCAQPRKPRAYIDFLYEPAEAINTMYFSKRMRSTHRGKSHLRLKYVGRVVSGELDCGCGYSQSKNEGGTGCDNVSELIEVYTTNRDLQQRPTCKNLPFRSRKLVRKEYPNAMQENKRRPYARRVSFVPNAFDGWTEPDLCMPP